MRAWLTFWKEWGSDCQQLVLQEFSLPLPNSVSRSPQSFVDPFPHWNASWRQHRLVNCLIQLLLPNPRPISSFCTSWCCRLFLLWKVSPLISAELLWYVVFCLSPSLSMASSTQLLNTSVLSSTFVFLLSTLPLVYLWGVVHIYKFDYDSLVSFLQSMLYTV